MVEVKSEEPAPAPTRRETVLALIAAPLAALGLAAVAGLDAGAWARCAGGGLACWVLARRLGLGVLGALLAAVSFGGSAAVLAGTAAGRASRPEAGLFDVGMLLVVTALVYGWRSAPASSWLAALALPSVAALLLFVAWLFGAPWLALVPDALGSPGSPRGYLGAGSFAARTAPWVTLPTLALALAGALSPEGRLLGRGVVGPAACALFLAGVSGLAPVGPTALPGALLLALLAGDALESAGRAARVVAALTVVPLALAATWVDADLLDAPRIFGDPLDELVVLEPALPEHYVGPREVIQASGHVHASVPAASVRAHVERLTDGGRFVRLGAPAVEVESQREPDGSLSFRTRGLDMRRLPGGVWRWSLDVADQRGDVLGSRETGSFSVRHAAVLSPVTLLVLACMTAALALGRPRSKGTAVVLLLLTALQVFDLGRQL